MDYTSLFEPVRFLQAVCLAFLSILFLQSGLDKVFNYTGNLDWLQGHFSESPLKGSVRIMLPAITLLEVAAGAVSLLGLCVLILKGSPSVGFRGAQIATLSILVLFFGQRLAQDYDGAATLVIYFIVCLLSLYALGVLE